MPIEVENIEEAVKIAREFADAFKTYKRNWQEKAQERYDLLHTYSGVCREHTINRFYWMEHVETLAQKYGLPPSNLVCYPHTTVDFDIVGVGSARLYLEENPTAIFSVLHKQPLSQDDAKEELSQEPVVRL